MKRFLCTVAALCAWPAASMAADPPTPQNADVAGYAVAPGFAAAVYTVDEPVGDKNFRNTYLEIFQGKGSRYRRATKLRVSRDVGRQSRYTLEVVELSKGRRVLRFRSEPDSEDEAETVGRDGFLGVFIDRAPFTTIWANTIDPFEPRQRIEFEDIDGNGTLEIVQAQADSGVLFCGRSHARLFPRIWDFKSDSFVAAPLLPSIAKGAAQVTAGLAPDAPRVSHFPDLISFRAASSDASAGSSGIAAIPLALSDGTTSTAWVEGGRGWGRGQFVTANVNQAFEMRGLRITPGHAASAQTFSEHGIPKMVLLSFDDGEWLKVELPKTSLEDLKGGGGLYIEFPKPKRSSCVTMTLLDAQPATARSRYQRTAISEMMPIIDLDTVPRDQAVALLLEGMATEESPRRRRELLELAGGLGQELAPAMTALITKETGETTHSQRLERLIPLLGALPTEDATEVLNRLLSYEGLTKTELALIQRAVSFKVRSTIDALLELALSKDTAPQVRQRAVRIVGRAGDSERMVELAPLLGQGDAALRRSVVRGLSRATIDAADPILALIESNPDSEITHDGLWALDRITRRHLRGKTGELPRGARIMKAYNTSEDVQIRLRAVRLMTRITAPNADVFLVTILQSQERPEIRLVAAEALAIHTSDKATEALIGALKDSSPSVRFESIKSLTDRSNRPSVVNAVLDYARAERWKRGLTFAYKLLASSSQRKGPDHLYDVIEADDQDRRLMALMAITAARQNVRPLKLIPIIRAEDASDRVRQEALQAMTYTKDPDSEAILIEVLEGHGVFPELLQATAARSMGQRRTKRHLTSLLKTVRWSERPKVQRACIRALAFYRSREALGTLIGLRSKVDIRTRRYLEESITAITERLEIKSR